jgi:hypothetical protein
MQVSITLFDLGAVILFAIGCAVGIYAILAFKYIHSAAKEITDFLHRHRQDWDNTILHLSATAENTNFITTEAKKGLGEAEKAIQTISRSTTDTVLRVNETADQVSTYVIVFGEIAKAILEFFPTSKRN